MTTDTPAVPSTADRVLLVCHCGHQHQVPFDPAHDTRLMHQADGSHTIQYGPAIAPSPVTFVVRPPDTDTGDDPAGDEITRLKAVRVRLEAATPGPWTWADDGLIWPNRLGDPVGGANELADAEFIAHAPADIAALLADLAAARAKIAEQAAIIAALRAELATYKQDDRHIVEFRDDGWTIQHPLACRPNLFDCEINRVASAQLTKRPAELGRFYCDVEAGRLRIGNRIKAEDNGEG